MPEIRDRVRMRIVNWLAHYDSALGRGTPPSVSEAVDQILAIDGLTIVDREAELPDEIMHEIYLPFIEYLSDEIDLSSAVQKVIDILCKAGWVKEVKKDES